MRWNIKEKPTEEKIKQLSAELVIGNTIASLLLQRGVTNFEQAKNFFRPDLNNLHDPYLMKDMEKAVFRVEKAIANNENILIFGDYDVDGTTAVSLVYAYLKKRHNNVATYIPDRYLEGYGISYQGIDYADDNNCTLIIALDCGIKSVNHVEYALQKNIDFIICDHHLPGNILPNAVAILNPKQQDCNYPYKELCGCGVGFKLIQALGKNIGETMQDLMPYLDLVVTAIAADIVPITGENRILAYHGLKVINSNPRNGIKAFLHQSKKKTFDISDIVFTIAPRINAAGRVKHGIHAVNLLTELNFEEALHFASEIEEYNSERKELDKQITSEALLQIEENKETSACTTVVFNENWHKGVIGIVASRLIETYYRPTIVFTKSGDFYAASARSVKGFDLYKTLESCSEHLEQFGGHKYAAGMTIKPENYLNFKKHFEKIVQKTMPSHLSKPVVEVDAVINFNDISPKFIRILNQMEPFGPENMTPVFKSENVIDTGYAKGIGQEEEHLKLFLKQNNSQGIAAIGFGLGEKLNTIKKKTKFQIAYSISENEWNGKIITQLQLKDIQVNEK